VQEAQLDVLRFWCERGADGFRIDALRQLIKDDEWRDNPPDAAWREGGNPYDRLVPEYTTDRPEVLDMVARMRAAVGPERVLIGELYLPLERLVRYYGAGLDLPTNFHLLSTPWEAEAVGELIARYEAALPEGAWPNWVLGNHDRPRLATRVGAAQVLVAAVLLLTLRGTPTLYYGDELGLRDVAVPPDRVQDPFEKRVPGKGLGRDPVRAPMPWTLGRNAGFCPPEAEPWLPLDPDAEHLAVAADPPALRLYRRLLALRRAEPALAEGDWRDLRHADGVLAYVRGGAILVALNLTGEERALELGELAGEVVLSARGLVDGERLHGSAPLAPDDALVVRLG
jgi:alpha-glucosidase